MNTLPIHSSDQPRQRILVVDDDPAVLDLVVTRLEIAGYETRQARDGTTAVARLDEVRPAAVILDLNMPRMDGMDVLALMSRREDLADVPVLVLSARGSPDDIKLAIAAGARDYLVKPFRTSQLLARVARLLGTRRKSRSSSPTSPDIDDPFLV